MQREICITVAGGHDLTAAFDPHFGRAPAFLLTDPAGADVSVIPNASADAPQGAGPRAAAAMGELGVRHVIAGHFGPKAESALAAIGAAMWLAPEGLAAHEVLARFRDGALPRHEP